MKKVILLFVFAIFSTSMLTAQSKEIQQDSDAQTTQVVEKKDRSDYSEEMKANQIVEDKKSLEESKKKDADLKKKNDDLKKRREIAREKALQNYVAPTAEELEEKKAKQNKKQ